MAITSFDKKAPNGESRHLDALVIGAGFSGLYQLLCLRDRLGLSVQVLEAGARMFDDLIALGIAEVSDGYGTLSVVPITWTADDVAQL